MRVPVKFQSITYVMDEDGEFRCPHDNVEVEYDVGGDGYTEPGPSWSVYCSDCHNDDLTDSEADTYIELAMEPDEPDYDRDEY